MNKYIINHPNGHIDIIQGDGIEHDGKTGQSIIYRNGTVCTGNIVVAVVAASSSVVLLDVKQESNDSKV